MDTAEDANASKTTSSPDKKATAGVRLVQVAKIGKDVTITVGGVQPGPLFSLVNSDDVVLPSEDPNASSSKLTIGKDGASKRPNSSTTAVNSSTVAYSSANYNTGQLNFCDPNVLMHVSNVLEAKQAEFTQKGRNAQIFFQSFQQIRADVNLFMQRAPACIPLRPDAAVLIQTLKAHWLQLCTYMQRCVIVITHEAMAIGQEIEKLEKLRNQMILNMRQQLADQQMADLYAAQSIKTAGATQPTAKKQKTSDSNADSNGAKDGEEKATV